MAENVVSPSRSKAPSTDSGGYAFLGSGCCFPVAADKVTGRFLESAYEENIRESIYLIVMTRKGERVMRPDFGCDIHRFVFEAINYTTQIQMQQAVREALLRWEPRISDIEVKINAPMMDDNLLEISISYRVRTTNSPYNLVFPFYLKET